MSFVHFGETTTRAYVPGNIRSISIIRGTYMVQYSFGAGFSLSVEAKRMMQEGLMRRKCNSLVQHA